MRKRVVIPAAIIAVVLLTLLISSTYALFKSSGTSTDVVSSANFTVLLNNSSEATHYIDLVDTIDNNDYSTEYVVPGTEGHFTLTLKFQNVETNATYSITKGTGSFPNNLKIYTDSNRTQELTTLNGEYTMNGTNTFTHTFYWKWLYVDNSQSNANDSLYQNASILLPLVVYTEQKTGSN